MQTLLSERSFSSSCAISCCKSFAIHVDLATLRLPVSESRITASTSTIAIEGNRHGFGLHSGRKPDEIAAIERPRANATARSQCVSCLRSARSGSKSNEDLCFIIISSDSQRVRLIRIGPAVTPIQDQCPSVARNDDRPLSERIIIPQTEPTSRRLRPDIGIPSGIFPGELNFGRSAGIEFSYHPKSRHSKTSGGTKHTFLNRATAVAAKERIRREIRISFIKFVD